MITLIKHEDPSPSTCFSAIAAKAISIIVAVGLFITCGCNRAEKPHSLVVFAPDNLDLGEIQQGSIHKITLKLQNNSPYLAKIRQIHVSCGCLVPEDFDGTVLEPGQSCQIPVTYSPGMATGFTERRILGDVQLLESHQLSEYPNFTLNARVKEEITIRPPQLRKTVSEYQKETIYVTLRSNNKREYTIQKISCTSRLMDARANNMSISPTSDTHLSVTVDLSNPLLNEVTGDIVLHLDGGIINRISIPVSYHRFNKIYISDVSMLLKRGDTTPHSTTITTSRPSRVNVSTSTNINASLSASLDDTHHTLTIRQSSDLHDQPTDTVRILIQSALDNSTPATVEIPIYYESE